LKSWIRPWIALVVINPTTIRSRPGRPLNLTEWTHYIFIPLQK
jgi:hypothetical protein